MFGSAWTPRRFVAVVVSAAVSMAGLALMAPAEAAPAQAGPPAQVLDRDLRGEAAINALGSRLPAVAAQNDMSAAEFRAALREDWMLWVSRTGRLLFVDEFAAEAPLAHGALDSTVVPSDVDVFKLHSRTPGTTSPTTRVIVLDFDGHNAQGTAWGNTAAQNTAAFDFDGGAETFTAAERAVIFSVWQRVAEDYAPFDIDVTTEDPGPSAINRSSTSDSVFGTRVVVTPSKPYNCNCGGVAYVGVYDETGDTHDYYQPAWVFTAGVGYGAKNIAEAASHEAGHNLGLSHDGTRRVGYYTGHGDWAPIMGVGYYEPISQWSRGEYSGGTNKEDDFSVIQLNGGLLAADDWPGTAPLTSPVSGVIGSSADVDTFSFSVPAGGGSVLLEATPATVSPNLDIELSILDGSGTLVARSDPSSEPSSGNDLSVGLGASIATTLAAGSYTARVDGVGWGDPSSNGYSGYGSVGRYTLTAGGGGGTTPSNQPPTAGFQVTKNGLTVTVDASASTDPDPGDELSYTWDFGGTGTAGADPTAAKTSYTYASNGTYTITLVVTDGNGGTDTGTEPVTVKASKGGGRPAKVR